MPASAVRNFSMIDAGSKMASRVIKSSISVGYFSVTVFIRNMNVLKTGLVVPNRNFWFRTKDVVVSQFLE